MQTKSCPCMSGSMSDNTGVGHIPFGLKDPWPPNHTIQYNYTLIGRRAHKILGAISRYHCMLRCAQLARGPRTERAKDRPRYCRTHCPTCEDTSQIAHEKGAGRLNPTHTHRPSTRDLPTHCIAEQDFECVAHANGRHRLARSPNESIDFNRSAPRRRDRMPICWRRGQRARNRPTPSPNRWNKLLKPSRNKRRRWIYLSFPLGRKESGDASRSAATPNRTRAILPTRPTLPSTRHRKHRPLLISCL